MGQLFNAESFYQSQLDARGGIELRLGDSLQLMADMGPNSVDLIVTSPPYNLNIDYDSIQDNREDKDYFDWLKSIWSQCYRLARTGTRLCVNGPMWTRHNSFWAYKCWTAMAEAGWKFYTIITWHKTEVPAKTAFGSFGSPSQPYIPNPDEVILVGYKDSPNNAANGRQPIITPDEFVHWVKGSWDIMPESATKIGHPAPYPPQLVERLIKLLAYKGDLVLDPFNGSGTTGVVAVQLGCRYIGLDISSNYLDLSRKRIFEALSTRLPAQKV